MTKLISKFTIVCVLMLFCIFTTNQAKAQGNRTSVSIFLGDIAIVSGAFSATGDYTMDAVGHGNYNAFHCTTVCTFSNGTLNLMLDCEYSATNNNANNTQNHGTWRIVGGTGAYANMQ